MIPSAPAQQALKTHARQIFEAAIEAVGPQKAVHRHVVRTDNLLQVGDQKLDLDNFERILLVGAGKASAPMADAMEKILGERVTDGSIVVKDGHGMSLKSTSVFEASHPVPDHRGVLGSEAVLALTAGAGSNDLVICLISGGGSALLIAFLSALRAGR